MQLEDGHLDFALKPTGPHSCRSNQWLPRQAHQDPEDGGHWRLEFACDAAPTDIDFSDCLVLVDGGAGGPVGGPPDGDLRAWRIPLHELRPWPQID